MAKSKYEDACHQLVDDAPRRRSIGRVVLDRAKPVLLWGGFVLVLAAIVAFAFWLDGVYLRWRLSD